jgi:hypothetical protein
MDNTENMRRFNDGTSPTEHISVFCPPIGQEVLDPYAAAIKALLLVLLVLIL